MDRIEKDHSPLSAAYCMLHVACPSDFRLLLRDLFPMRRFSFFMIERGICVLYFTANTKEQLLGKYKDHRRFEYNYYSSIIFTVIN